MTLIVAVSGGVDSVVLLDTLVRAGNDALIVAHFDHGIRVDSASDADFVRHLAATYDIPFETKREELGGAASEELARERRYAFLCEVAEKYQGDIVTAHHMNDVAETIAINLSRGTGWRGVAVLASPMIKRPLLGMTKQELIHYATRHKLAWREDSTNASDAYLRNRIRPRIADDDMVRQLAALRARQVELRHEIDDELAKLPLHPPYSRHFLTMIDESIAQECLRYLTNGRLTRPQQKRTLLAIKSARPGRRYEAGAGVTLDFTSRHFTVQMIN